MKVIDLVKRLRCDHPDQLTCEAADRIEELEAKLAEAVEAAFRDGFGMAASLTPHVYGVYSRSDDAWNASKARNTLAELKGQNDE